MPSPPRRGFVLLTLGKELRETLRDRRTLAVMVLVPLVIYPLLALVGTQVMSQRSAKQEARASAVAVLGTDPAADELRRRIDRLPKLFARQAKGSAADVDEGRLDALVTIGFAGSTASRAGQAPTHSERVPAEITLDATREEGRRAETRLSEELDAMWPDGCTPRFAVSRNDLAPKTRLGGYVLSQVLPIMILLMVLLGAFYPAIDVTAGERERGTLETVLVAPIPRIQLLFGKVLAVTILATASGVLNLGSMTLTLVQVVNMAAPSADLPVPFARAAATGLVIVPTAFLLAGLFVAIGSLARGFKEAQNLLVPVYFLFFAPAILGALGDLALGPGLALVPGLNVSLLARDIALGKASWGMTALVLVATFAWGLAALAAAARLYVSERFLAVGDDDGDKQRRRGPGLRGSALFRTDPPSAGEAMALFAIGYLLLYFVFIPLQQRDLIRGLLISQWAGLIGLSFAFALITKRRPRAAFGLVAPSSRALAAAVLVGLGGWMLANLASQWIAPPPKEYIEAFRRLLFPEANARGLATNLFLFALTPAICEELFFRGLLLRGLLTRMSPGSAIAISAAMFALFHVDVYRLLPTALLGVMLGFVAYRAGTFLASVVVHFLNNGILVLLGAADLDRRIDALGTAANVVMLAAASLVVAAGITLLLRTPLTRPLGAPPDGRGGRQP
jgi:sodium transport system permease protein